VYKNGSCPAKTLLSLLVKLNSAKPPVPSSHAKRLSGSPIATEKDSI
jgi:hypothetical protein